MPASASRAGGSLPASHRRARRELRAIGSARSPTGDGSGCPPEEIGADLNRFLRGWGGYFRYGNSTRCFDKIDSFTGRLLRLADEVATTGLLADEAGELPLQLRDLAPPLLEFASVGAGLLEAA